MIICVTLNPCLDKTLTVPRWKPGENVRGTALREVVGGKGNNVARALSRLGHGDVRPALFLGGATGKLCERLLCDGDGLRPLIVTTQSDTRVILTVCNEPPDPETSTAFFDPNPEIRPVEARQLLSLVAERLNSGAVRALTLSGSSPCAATHELYSELIAAAAGARVPVFVDTYGPALEAIWGFWPTVLQLNRHEAALHLKKDAASDDHLWSLLRSWQRRGVQCAVVTCGAEPAIVLCRGAALRVHPPRIELVNATGSGDCFLAGLVDGWLRELDDEGLVRRAAACGAANAAVWDAGAIDAQMVERLEDRLRIDRHP